MVFLLLTILLNVYLSAAFKLFHRWGIEAFPAIVVNYWVCVATGSVMLGRFPIGAASLHQPWLPWAVGLGAGFITVFNLIAWCTREDGITATTVANKLSLVIPVLFALAFYAGERFHWTKAVGIACAIPAVYWSTRDAKAQAGRARRRAWLAPVALFVGSGVLDTIVSYVTRTFFSGPNTVQQPVYLIHTFATAGTVGAVVLAIQLARGQRRWSWRDAAGGVVLGVPNYFSIYFLLRLLADGPFQPSAAIPIVNIGIVVAAALSAILFFREPATQYRWAGVGLALVAIALLAYSDLVHA